VHPGQFIATESPVEPAVVVHVFAPLAQRQLIGGAGNEDVGAVVTGAAFVQIAIRQRRDARAGSVVVIAIVERFRVGVEAVEHEPLRVPFLELHGAGMVGGVAGVRHVVDAAELRVRQVGLRIAARRRLERGIAGSEVRGEDVAVPTLDEMHAGRALVEEAQKVVGTHLILDARVPVHDITGVELAVHPGDVT